MSISLSVLLPVHNAEDRLSTNVAEILDVLPELTPHFEVLIIDDGSLDDTAETAYSLARCYPQVNVVRHPIRLGLSQAIESGLESSGGEIVFVGDEQHGLDPRDLRKLWQMRGSYVPGEGRGAKSASGRNAWVERLLNWRPHGRSAGSRLAGIQIIQRQRAGQVESLKSFTSDMRRDAGGQAPPRPNISPRSADSVFRLERPGDARL